MSTIGAVGQLIGLRGIKTPAVTLTPGMTRIIPAGNFMVAPGPYTFVQALDPITGIWRNMATVPQVPTFVESDGVNFRLANQTGCCVGALVTVAGTGYVGGATGVTVSASTGAAVFAPVVGGAIAATGTFTSVGTGYTYAPSVDFTPPPAGGVPATGHVTISSSTGSTLVIDNQGAGYTTVPTATITNDPRDATGNGMTIGGFTIASTAAGAITACLVTNHGVAVATVPSLSTGNSGAGTSATLTAIMCFAVTAGTVATVGSVYGTAASLALSNGGLTVGTTSQWTNPATDTKLFQPRPAYMILTAGTSLSTVSSIIDGGLHLGLPTVLVLNSQSVITAGGAVTVTAGGVTDTSFIIPV